MAANPIVNRWLDLADRVGWTAIQASAGAVLAYLVTDGVGWEEGLVFVGTAALAAICKVVIGQRTGGDETGALIGRTVVEPAPVAGTTKAASTVPK